MNMSGRDRGGGGGGDSSKSGRGAERRKKYRWRKTSVKYMASKRRVLTLFQEV